MSNIKWDWLLFVLSIKNLQFLSNQDDILPKYPIQELVILVKYQLDWKKIVDIFNNSMRSS